MANTLHKDLTDALAARSEWEQKQRAWYLMTLEGLRRRKTAGWQADMFWPLIGESVQKLVPFYYNQIFSQERLANFVATKSQWTGASEAAAEYFDVTIRQDAELDATGEFETEWLLGIWFMLVYGRGTMKVLWDPFKERITHTAIHPLSLIVPKCDKLSEADCFCHARSISIGQYQRDRRLVQDPRVIEKIKGNPNAATDRDVLDDDRSRREGITYSRNANEVLLWEAYQRTAGGWTVHTYSPQAPEIPLRRPFGLSEKWRGEPFLPFVPFSMEVIEGGWYGPRGVAERLAPFQAYLCKTWNEKVDTMTFSNRPLFTNTGAQHMANVANVTWAPGEFIPGGISAVTMPQPPISFDQEMATTRSLAAETITMPDAGVAGMDANSPTGRGKMTATEIDYRRALASTGVDLRGRLFRLALGQSYRKDWALIVNHKPEELAYFVAGERKVLPAQALHDQYTIEPAGSPDYWHKSLRMNRALARLQTLQGNPYVRQDELVKDFLTADNSDLVTRLWIPDGQKQAEEAEQEAMRIEALLMKGYKPAIKPHEDHATRLQVIFQKLEALQKLGAPVDPIARQRLQEAAQVHLQFLQQQNPDVAKQVMTAVGQMDPGTQGPASPLSLTPPGPTAPMPEPAMVPGLPEPEPFSETQPA
jgi:hypothetical protein